MNDLYLPVIIIAAARSGTNLLRDILTRLPDVGTWPCDEINYIWRHGNRSYPTDEFSNDMAKSEVVEFIRNKFLKLKKSQNIFNIVEKTCANSLRVSFVNEIFPEAKFIFLVRDGRDVVNSALKRWKASLDFLYILKKARFIPISDIPYYAFRYLNNRIYRMLSKEKRLAVWGPKFKDLTVITQTKSLPEVCAVQWLRCLTRTEEDLLRINSDRIFRLRYEDFVLSPKKELSRITEFLNITVSEELLRGAVKSVSQQNIAKWRNELDMKTLKIILPYMTDVLKRYNYEV